jgi:hypothetical protein
MYSQKGLVGCGATVARAVVMYGFGDSLCHSARILSRREFEGFLVKWRDNLREFIREDPANTMGSRHPSLAASIPDSFPDRDIILLYLFPTTSPTETLRLLGSNHCLPDIIQITRVCELYFPWATPETILVKFESSVFQVVLMAVLREEVVLRETRDKHFKTESVGVRAASFVKPSSDLSIQLQSNFTIMHHLFPTSHFEIGSQQTRHGIVHREVSGSIKHLQRMVLWSLRGLRQVKNVNRKSRKDVETRKQSDVLPPSKSDHFKMWIPESLLMPLFAPRDIQLPSSSTASTSTTSQHPDLKVDIPTIRQAFLTPTIDAPTLATIVAVFLTSETSPNLNSVIGAFVESISTAPRRDPTYKLLCRYVEVASRLPPSISHDILTPISDAFRAFEIETSAETGDIPSKPTVSLGIYFLF